MSTEPEWAEQIARELSEYWDLPVEHFWTYTRGRQEGDEDWRLDVWRCPIPMDPLIGNYWICDWRPSFGDPIPNVKEDIIACGSEDILDVLADGHEDPDEAWQIWNGCIVNDLSPQLVQILQEVVEIRHEANQ